jgi:hypothetical protein
MAMTLGIAAASVAAAGHALAWKRDPRSALGWLAVAFLIAVGVPAALAHLRRESGTPDLA